MTEVEAISYRPSPDIRPRDFATGLGLELAKELGATFVRVEPSSQGPGLSDCCVIVRNAEGHFILVDNQDGPSNTYGLQKDPGFRGALVGQWTHAKMVDYFGHDLAGGKVEPGFYMAGYPEEVLEMRPACQKAWRATVRKKFYDGCQFQRLFFSGSVTRWPGNRRVAEVLRDNWPRDVAVFDGLLPHKVWMEAAAAHVLNLVLPLCMNYSWRDIDLLGLGLPFVSIEYTNELRDPLVPDVHYFAVRGVPVDPKTGVTTDHELAARRIWERHLEARTDTEALLAMSDEAVRWYDRAADPKAVAKRVAEWTRGRMEV